MTDAFVAFWSGMLCGMIVGVFIFSVIIAIKTGELKREQEARHETNDNNTRI